MKAFEPVRLARCFGVVVVALLAAATSSKAASTTELVIRTDPPGASVEIDGRHRGETPLRLHFPSAYFKPRNLAWARHLPDPIRATLRLEGYKTREVELGTARRFVALNPVSSFKYYQLEPSYSFQLEVVATTSKPATDGDSVLSDLERLASLFDRGLLTPEEFTELKARVMNSAAGIPSAGLEESKREPPKTSDGVPRIPSSRLEQADATWDVSLPGTLKSIELGSLNGLGWTLDGSFTLNDVRFSMTEESLNATFDFSCNECRLTGAILAIVLLLDGEELPMKSTGRLMQGAEPNSRSLEATWQITSEELRDSLRRETAQIRMAMSHLVKIAE